MGKELIREDFKNAQVTTMPVLIEYPTEGLLLF